MATELSYFLLIPSRNSLGQVIFDQYPQCTAFTYFIWKILLIAETRHTLQSAMPTCKAIISEFFFGDSNNKIRYTQVSAPFENSADWTHKLTVEETILGILMSMTL